MVNNKKGIALIEVVIAVLILIAYIIFNTIVYINSYNNVLEARKTTVANNLLVKAVEEVRNANYATLMDSVSVETISSTNYTINIDVQDTSIIREVKERFLIWVTTYRYTYPYKIVNVEVSWDDESDIVSVLRYNPNYTAPKVSI